jgi:hypothetical protein
MRGLSVGSEQVAGEVAAKCIVATRMVKLRRSNVGALSKNGLAINAVSARILLLQIECLVTVV